MKRFAGWALSLMLFGGGVANAELEVGDAAPEFKLPGTDGNTHSLSDMKGKIVVLAWFPKAFTGG